MGDAGEGLIDADARIQERMDELEQDRKQRRQVSTRDPALVQRIESLRLARTDLQRQLGATTHEARRQQLQSAIAQLETQLKTMGV